MSSTQLNEISRAIGNDEKFCVISRDSDDVWFKDAVGKPIIDPYLTFNVKSFIKETLLSTINKIGLEKRECNEQSERLFENRDIGYNQAVRDLQKVKQDLINQLIK